MVKNAKKKRLFEDDYDVVSHFIWCVKKRPPLYNYKLPAEQRRRNDVARIWKELAEEVGGGVTVDDCRNRWKNLRDTYHQYRLRKAKFKECLEKWRYTKDLSFLTDVYQPKLKAERIKYFNSKKDRTPSESNDSLVHEVKMSDISSLIEVDEGTEHSQESHTETMHNDIIINDNSNNDSEEQNMEHADINSMELNSTKKQENDNVNATIEDTYGEVFLYDETEEPVDNLLLDSKENIRKNIPSNRFSPVMVEIPNGTQRSEPTTENSTTDNKSAELDLFFQFLKTKVQNLPNVDITGIQIEFLNVVLRKESALNQEKSDCL